MVIDTLLKYWGNQYVQVSIIFLVVILAAKILMIYLKKNILKLTSKTKTTLDDELVQKIHDPIFLLFTIIAVKIYLFYLGISDTISTYLSYGINSVLIILTGYVIIVMFNFVIDTWGRKWTQKSKSKIDDQLLVLFHKITHIVIWIVIALVVLDQWGVQIGPMLASLGIAGIAIAFALQSSLSNIFGGISLILDKTFKTGDIIKLDDSTVGTVIAIGLRSTKIRTFDNEMIIVPNGNLSNSKIQNFVPPDPSVRVVIPFGVAYGSDIEQVKKIVLKETRKIKHTLKEPEPHIKFLEMADSSLNFKLFFFIEKYDYIYEAMDRANTLIYDALNKKGINIPFPQMDVHVKKN
jgi:MscS family membrane protein